MSGTSPSRLGRRRAVVWIIAVVTMSVIAVGGAFHIRSRIGRSGSGEAQPPLPFPVHAVTAPDSIPALSVREPADVIEIVVEARPVRDAVILSDARGRVTMIASEGDTIRAGAIVARLEIARTAAPAGATDARLRKAEADLVQKRRALERSEALLAAGGISRREHEAAKRAFEAAERTLTAMSEAARAAMAAPPAGGASNLIRAPFDALILDVSARRGATVSPGAHLLRIAEISVMEVAAFVGEEDTLRIEAGDSVEIVFDDLAGETFVATIERVDRGVVEGGRLSEVVAMIPNPGMRLAAGMVGRMRIQGRAE
jgi:RND family efflux transporter MFP subunit